VTIDDIIINEERQKHNHTENVGRCRMEADPPDEALSSSSCLRCISGELVLHVYHPGTESIRDMVQTADLVIKCRDIYPSGI
jgi:hypothetical protein